MKLLIVTILCAASLASCSSTNPGTEPNDEDLAILFIGNSLTYTNDLPEILRDLLESSESSRIVVESIANPNYGLEDHWNRLSTVDRISSAPWDYVILQQGPSASEGRPSLLEYSKLFGERIKSAGATPAMYMVWPEEQRMSDFTRVRESYRAAADSIDGLFLPGGAAWQEYWTRLGDVDLYGPDNFHPSPEGSYLAAVVMWEQISGGDANDLDQNAGTKYGSVSVPFGLGEKLHDSAHAANRKFARVIAGERKD